VDNELEKKLQKAFDKFERDGTVDSDDSITTMFVENRAKRKREWWQSKKPESEWEYDAYFDQPTPGLIQQERVTYKRRDDGKIERETIVRRFYGNNDYQDSTTTEII
jgi:hypothetical protein